MSIRIVPEIYIGTQKIVYLKYARVCQQCLTTSSPVYINYKKGEGGGGRGGCALCLCFRAFCVGLSRFVLISTRVQLKHSSHPFIICNKIFLRFNPKIRSKISYYHHSTSISEQVLMQRCFGLQFVCENMISFSALSLVAGTILCID